MKKTNHVFAMAMVCSILAFPALAQGKKKEPDIIITPEMEAVLKQMAEDQAIQDTFPSPSSVIRRAEEADNVDRAMSKQLDPPSKIVPKDIVIEPRAGKKPTLETIYIYPNQITTLTVVDSLGQPWPLKAPPVVGANGYDIHYDKEIPGVMTIETTTKYVPTSLAMVLEGRVKPIQFQLRNNGYQLDYDVTVTIKGKSPTNSIQVITETYNIPTLNEGDIKQFLYSPPSDANPLRVLGDKQTSIWAWNGKCVIRTPHEIINSGTPTSIQSAPNTVDYVSAYQKLPEIIPMQVRETGEIINIRVQGGC